MKLVNIGFGNMVSADRVVSTDALVEVLWEDRPPAGARAAIHSAVGRLRSTLGAAGARLIGTSPPGYVLRLGHGEFDVRRFGVLAAQGQTAARAGLSAQASQASAAVASPMEFVTRRVISVAVIRSR